ncbi:MAG TPA: aminoacyl-tRNA hydrolase [Trueperaceae bacterium]
MIVGLGNPGPRYEGTRHNAGFLVVDELASRADAAFRRLGRGDASRDEARVNLGGGAGSDVLLVKPQGFMNLSGAAVQAALARHRARPADLVVVHDDVDLPLGRLRFKQGGGAGGQKGVRHIIERIGPEFVRLKVGVSRPPEGWATDAWVLARFGSEDRDLVSRVVAAAADAVEALAVEGLDAVMNRVNGLDLATHQ